MTYKNSYKFKRMFTFCKQIHCREAIIYSIKLCNEILYFTNFNKF